MNRFKQLCKRAVSKFTFIGNLIFRSFYKSDSVYIAFFEDIGSAVYPLSYLNELKKKFYSKKIIAVTSVKYKELCSLWKEIDRIIVLSPLQISFFKTFLAAKSSNWKYEKGIFHFYSNKEISEIIRYAYCHDKEYENMTIQNVIHSTIFRCNPITKPCKGDAYSVNNGKAMELVKRFGLIEGKTVILIPDTVSGDMFPNFFWYNVAKKLTEMGYKVLTNTFSDESVVAGTQKIDAPLEFMPFLVKYCGYALCNQTGLGDLLHMCGCPCSMALNYGIRYFLMSGVNDTTNKSLYELLEDLPTVEKNRYNKALLGIDPYVFDNTYADIYDSSDKLTDLVENFVADAVRYLEGNNCKGVNL